ncbi:SpoIIE family protein phosphatase [Streptomyces anulatus]|uniref:SpoIIE family protein phosphatase n=1 Tax=Streptomyces TaxID=1883 RepID=UPI00067E4340|nr:MULTISPECIES: SpoIIE family protein phosphatase [Streptomyces]KND23929.1 protein phosphatase [Streptomyces europaeiscabiei]KPL30298.1 protein phosphatase [Streptomyces anulatus]KQX30627.1 protein phosphatase [Streptomyces sp. Root1295]KRA40560.1 protein phosphatase [Streptomyces sp. Root63]OKI78313.1 protein phosphatase [Streptomyces sp. TSRI0395]
MASADEGSPAEPGPLPSGDGPEPARTTDGAAAVIAGDGTVIGWTRGAEALLGYPAAEVVGRSAALLLTGPPDARRTAAVAARCRAGSGWSGLVPLRARDGRSLDIDVRATASFLIAGREGFLVSGRELTPHWTMRGSVLDDFLTRSPVGMAVLDPELRYLWLNDTLERFGGVPREQRLGRRPSEVLPAALAAPIERLMRQVLSTGEAITDYEYLGWSWADPHRRRAYASSFFPLADAGDRQIGIGYMVLDVTDRWNARRLLALVNEAGASIGSTLDVQRTAQELADFAVPRFADFVFVDLLENPFGGDRPGAPAPAEGERPAMRRAGMSSVREGCPEAVVRVGETVDFVPPPHDAHFLLDGDPVLLPALDPDSHGWTVEQPERAARLREFGLHSLISVPMRARDTVLGLTTFMRSQNPVPFDEDDVAPARELVARAAVCVDNARRYTREHTAALVLQRSLLPHTLRGGTALDVASSYLPADAKDGVGGDWFDVIPLSGARVGLVIGDVVGHGIGAAATMGRLRTAVQTLADMDLPPDELLARLDDLVLRLSEEERAGGPAERGGTTVVGATCLYAVYDPASGCCTMARAGHPPPVVVTPDNTVSFPDLPTGPPLGLGGLPFESLEIELPEGSLLGLYTDGLIEGADKDLGRGMERLGRAVSRDGMPLKDLCPAVVKELLPVPQPDDIALLLARTHRLSPEHLASWDVPVDPAAVGETRAKVSRRLEAWGLEDLSMTTELIVSELVTNAIRYGAGPVRLRLLFQSALTCEVSDASNTSPRLRHARTTDEGGRGLFLVAQLAHRWGTRYTPQGKIIWAEQPLP